MLLHMCKLLKNIQHTHTICVIGLITPNSRRGLVSILISTGHDKDKGNVLGQLAEIRAKWKGEKEVGRSLFKHPLETLLVSLLCARYHSSEDESHSPILQRLMAWWGREM